METLVISAVLALALLGGWLLAGFVRYRRYFKQVDAFLATKKLGSLHGYPADIFTQLDDLIRRAYFAKHPVEQTAGEVIDEAIRLLAKR